MGVSGPIRLTVVMTHPVQYVAPWFRHIAASCPELDLTVIYAVRPTATQQGVGFDRPYAWDPPLVDGYRCRLIRDARPEESVDSAAFRGLDVPEIGDAIADTRPQVVLVPGWHSITLVRAIAACRRRGIPVLYRGDSNLATAPAGWRRPIWESRSRLLLRRFRAFLSVGRRSHDYLNHLGVFDARIFDSPHAVDNEFFRASAAPHQSPGGRARARESFGLDRDAFVVLFAGKLIPKKHPLDVVRATARLGSGANLLVVGSGQLEAAMRHEAGRVGARVAFAGFLNQSELGRAYAAADCLALPSDAHETWGLVVNEALATGLPAVVSDGVGCAPDLIVPAETGAVHPVGDVEALAAAMAGVRARRSNGHDFAPACRARVARYSFEAATAGLLAACRTMTAARITRAASRAHTRAPRVVACCGGMIVVSGLERQTFEALHALRERGAAVHCIVNEWDNQRIVDLARALGATWSTGRYGAWFRRGTRSPLRLLGFAYDIAATSAGLLRDAWRFRATHVLVPDFVTALRNAPALWALRLGGTRVILRLGNAPDPRPFYRRLWRWGVDPLVHRYVCNSEFTRDALLAHGVRADKAARIYNTLPSGAHGGNRQAVDRIDDRVIYVGQIIPGKGVDVLLEAAGLLQARGRGVTVDVVGDIDGWVPPSYEGYRDRLRARAARPDLASRVHFLGWRDDVPRLLAGAAVHCCPSMPDIREGFGLVNLEAKQAGIPSVVFPTGALPEVIAHGEDGWVCRDATAEALADGLDYFLSDRERRERAGRAARASLARFNRDRFAAAWWDLVGGAQPARALGRQHA